MIAHALALLLVGQAEEPPGIELRSALKSTGLLTRRWESAGPRDGAVSLWRLRLEPAVIANDMVSLELAWDLELRLQSEAGAAAPGVPLVALTTPWRAAPLEGRMGGGTWLGTHQLDRFAVKLELSRVQVTLGRQALGFGRGVLFSAVDVFSPFTPLQLDREWRRGVDAVRADVRVLDKLSIDAAVVFSQEWAQSAAVARARGYFGPVDVELLGGWRAGEGFVGVASSGAVFGTEVHGELAAFRPATGPWVWKAVAGASYDFRVGEGLHALVEYHYNGFGLSLPADFATVAAAEFQRRLVRGDVQVLGRHVAALSLSYPVTPVWATSLAVLVDPTDGAGIVSPAVAWDFAESASLAAGGFASWGAKSSATQLGSQFGGPSVSGFVQLRVYDRRRTTATGDGESAQPPSER